MIVDNFQSIVIVVNNVKYIVATILVVDSKSEELDFSIDKTDYNVALSIFSFIFRYFDDASTTTTTTTITSADT